jgi:hypothetical protein
MPMELLFALAQRELPVTVDQPCDIDKLRVIAAAQLVEARLPDVDSGEQKAEVLAILPQGRAALARAYPGHAFRFSPASDAPDWPASVSSYHVERDRNGTTLDS